ncbi:RNA polymerase, sigma 28 subunit, SigD/FliA/WhiG [Virgibacillus subterraneus]|uniref:RNA polymerase, sigma 28 subunit, SigD/FliA/WhiG n=2 Tax=Virgibacillus TaxID=84406 RepID=A0A1H1C7D0_9BACI|nr:MULTISPECIES: FliA/WhiG family RNA polymerase sigma factor [Virgibacillus]SDQ60085.1 RNA polymerase, sigma 28 subunit, SigD/FliA/WhiG [Virgibacillus salinus]SEQ57535.1 RNA polymerase, sigma 28 subunit, SigD/FliA/WhiG [Virgibacillus subterraneus]
MTTNKSPLEQKLWKNWLENKDNEAANELIENYMYLVTFHVERVSSHLPSNVNKDDLKSFGLMGLFDALNKFEHNRNLKFDTYASFRIRGAIIDGLRKEDWLPRSIREKTKRIEKVSQELEQSYQRIPTADEIAAKLEIPVHEVEELVKDSLFANILSIEEKPKDNSAEHKEGIGYTIPDESSISPDDHMLQTEIKQELTESIKLLNENEQMVVSLFYHQELTLTEIGQVLELTTSRISQIHRKAIFKLKNTINKMQSTQ